MNTENTDQVVHTPTWEKVLGAVGLALLCVGLIYLTWTAISEQQVPPSIAFTVKKITQVETGFLVEVEVLNNGTKAVSALNIEGRLSEHFAIPETSGVQVDYVAAGSTSSVGLFFTKDPREATLTFKPLGYQVP